MGTYFIKEDKTMPEATSEYKEKSKPKGKPRIHLLDEIRGFCVFCMVFYHAFYTIGIFFNWSWGMWLLNFFTPAEPFFAGAFIFISGISSNLSHSNIERGAKLFFISYIVTFVSFIAVGNSAVIRFGILHMLSICMMLYGILTKVNKLIPLWLGFLLEVVLFVLTMDISIKHTFGIPYLWNVSVPAWLYTTDFLYPLGFPQAGFISSDYFPLMPWLFLFFAGGFFGRLAVQKKFPKFSYKKHIPFFSLMGRYALIIYLLHQPVIFGICEGVKFVVSHINH